MLMNKTLPRFLRWLFKAEGLQVAVDKDDWEILAGMGSGADKGLKAAKIRNYEEAVHACQQMGSHNAASGAKYDLDI